MTATFNDDELARYARHLVLRDVGGPGQQRLKAAKVAVIGAGGLGAPILLYLAAAGVGTISVFDDDEVGLSNLQRQVIHATPDVGRPKVLSARDAVARLNPHVTVHARPIRLTRENAATELAGHDLVIDGSDNFTTRYLAADLCQALGLVLVTGAVSEFDGSVTVIVPGLDETGVARPTYRDVFPEAPPAGLLPTCAEAGVLGALTGVIGSLQALEAIKWITGVGTPLVGRLLLFDARDMTFESIKYRARRKSA
jgi:adenylyltransferase/sulfurtransferase